MSYIHPHPGINTGSAQGKANHSRCEPEVQREYSPVVMVLSACLFFHDNSRASLSSMGALPADEHSDDRRRSDCARHGLIVLGPGQACVTTKRLGRASGKASGDAAARNYPRDSSSHCSSAQKPREQEPGQETEHTCARDTDTHSTA